MNGVKSGFKENLVLTFSSLQINIDTFAKSADPYETAHNWNETKDYLVDKTR